MSGGEESVYSLTVTDNTTDYSYWHPTTDYSTSALYWSSPVYVYLYQITCPRCHTLQWAEVDKIITCQTQMPTRIVARKKVKEICGAKLKAVLDTVDFEIPVSPRS